jgi:L-amino acid N-acyltransferase YncA
MNAQVLTMIIRDFNERDVAPANELTNSFIRDTVVHFGFTPATDSEFADLWQQGRAKYPWLAAEEAGRFLGYAKAGVWRTRDAYQFTAEAGIYMVAEARGRGLGRQLYVELLERLRAAGFHSAIGGVTLPNEASVRLHESLGFRKVGDFREVGRKFDAWHDVGFWQIDLARV